MAGDRQGLQGLERPDAVERILRELLREREPSQAPAGLRRRLDRIPDEPPGEGRSRIVMGAMAWLAVAAVLVVAILAGQALRLSVPAVGPAATSAPSPTFDPAVFGPGVAPAPETAAPAALVLLASGSLVLLAIAMKGRRRLVPAVGAALLLGWLLVGSLYPVSASWYFVGPGLGVVKAEMPPAVHVEQFYVTAAPGEPFSIGLGVLAPGGPIPIRLDGIVGEKDVTALPGARWAAVWLDTDPNGGSRGPGEAFRPIDLNGDHPPQALWIVGRAGSCALGSSFDQHGTGQAAFTSMIPVLRVSVLGWPRTIPLTEPVIVEPDSASCPAPGSSSPSTPP